MCIAMECDLLIHIYGLLSAGGIPQKVQQARCCAAPACCAVSQPAQLPGAPGAAPWPGIPARYFYSSVFQSILIASPEPYVCHHMLKLPVSQHNEAVHAFTDWH